MDENSLNSWGKQGLEKSKIYLEKLINLCKEKDIEITLVVMEEAIVFLNSVDINFYKTFWEKISIENKINYIYLEDYHSNYTDKFQAYRDLFFIRDNHWNEKGNKLIAEEFLSKSDYLKKKIKN